MASGEGWRPDVPNAVAPRRAARKDAGSPSLVPVGTGGRPARLRRTDLVRAGAHRHAAADMPDMSQRNSPPPRQMLCITTESLRATATFARRGPMRAANF